MHSNIEAKNKLRNQVLKHQNERNRTSKVSPNLNINQHHSNEQNPLIFQQSRNMGSRVNQSAVNNQPNQRYRNQQSQIHRSDNHSINYARKSEMDQKSKSFYTNMDVLYGIICCSK